MCFCLEPVAFVEACLNLSEAGILYLQYSFYDYAICPTYHTCWSKVCEIETVDDYVHSIG